MLYHVHFSRLALESLWCSEMHFYSISMAVRIISLNTGGLGNQLKRRKIFKEYRDRCDVLCLQETHCTSEKDNLWQKEWGGLAFFANGTSTARGTAILINRKFYCNVIGVQKDTHGRFIILNCEIEDTELCIANIYAPNADSPGFFGDLLHILDNSTTKRIVIGDFNLVLNTDLDRNDSSFNNVQAAGFLKEKIEEEYLCDVWRDRHPGIKRYSWYRYVKNKLRASRIDFALVTQSIANIVDDCFYIKGIDSDHSAFVLVIKCTKNKRGKGYWKLNASLLQNPEYVNMMNQNLAEWTKIKSDSSVQLWEEIKSKVRKATRDFTKGSTSEKKQIMSNLMEKITEMEEDIETLSPSQVEMLENSKIDLKEISDDMTRSLIFRSKAKWIMEAERNTKYFYSLEKIRAEAKVSNVIVHNSREYTEGKEILNIQKEYYENLYKKNENVSFSLSAPPSLQVPSDSLAKSENVFSEMEIAKAVLSLKNNKTPGPDGIGIEFYKCFWVLIKDIVCGAIHEVYTKRAMIQSSSQGIINLIPKKGRDSRLLNNLRPITLLNSDYKIIEKAIAGRMIPAMEEIISKDQKGFLPRRKITVNIRKAFEVLKAVKNTEAVYITCDFKKAFDNISTESIWKTMRLYGFAEYLVQWTQILYTNFKAKIQNNGHFSSFFNIEQSVHQGAPNSCYYFILVAEILADSIRKNLAVYGISTKEIEALLSQFADDLDTSMTTENNSVDKFFDIIEWFRSLTGLELNYDKTTVYRIGSLESSKAQCYSTRKLKWSSGTMNILGVDVNENDEIALEANYKTIPDKIFNILTGWTTRGLSLEGKVNIVNTCIASLFVYKMSVLPTIPQATVNKVEKLIEDFLWGKDKRPKIPTKVLQRPVDKGGLKLMDLSVKDDAIKISWIKTIHEDSTIAKAAYENVEPDLKGVDLVSESGPQGCKIVV